MIKKLFSMISTSQVVEEAEKEFEDLHMACAFLFLEIAHLDGDLGEDESIKIRDLLTRKFSLAPDVSDRLYTEAQNRHRDMVEIHGFTHEIKSSFEEEERVELVEMLWEVAYTDGKLHDYEANLMRRLGGLLHVTDRQIGDARKRVLEKADNSV